MEQRDLVHHGLAIKRMSTAAAVAELIGLPLERVETLLAAAVAGRRAARVNESYTLTPLARVALDGRYRACYGSLRADAEFRAAYESFEELNHSLKQTITRWQTVEVGGSRVANDHGDKDYDSKVLDELSEVHERVERILDTLARHLQRLAIYKKKLLFALESAEDGDVAWVSDVRRDSYHTVWFELHEDLLRIMGRAREE